MTYYDIISVGASLIDLVALIDHFPSSDDEVFVPVLRREFGGSAANTAVACSRLGLKTAFVGKIGVDPFGDMILREFEKENVDTTHIIRTRSLPTGICFIAVDKNGDRRMFAHSGAANDISPSDFTDYTFIKNSKIFYLASLQNTDVLSFLSEKARGFNVKVAFNPGALIANQGIKAAEPILKNTSIYISSLSEAKRLFNSDNVDEISKVLFRYGVEVVAVTLGSKGCFVSSRDFSGFIRPFKVNVKDTTGAGDAFTAGFLSAFIRGAPVNECALAGAVVAALTIQHVGARNGLPTVDELLRFAEEAGVTFTVFGGK